MNIEIFKAWALYFLTSTTVSGLISGIFVWIFLLFDVSQDVVELFLLIVAIAAISIVSYVSFNWVVIKFILRDIQELTSGALSIKPFSKSAVLITVFIITAITALAVHISETIKKHNVSGSFETLNFDHQKRKEQIIAFLESIERIELAETDSLNRLLNDDLDRIGETIETTLIDEKGNLIGESRFSTPNTRVQVRSKYLDLALEGNYGKVLTHDHRGIQVLLIYSSIDVHNSRLALFTTMDIEEAEACGRKCW